jgi:flagellar FliJ protein
MPKKFTFRLQPILDIRLTEVNNAKNAFGKAMQARVAKEEEIAQAEDHIRSLMRQAGDAQHGMTSAQALEAQWYHVRAQKHDVKQMLGALDKLRAEEEQKRILLAEAVQRQKALERLKEKRVEEYTQDTLREEQQFLDELAQKRIQL